MLTPKDVDVSYRYLRRKCELEPEVAVILGSGIPRPTFDVVCEIPFAEVPHLTKPSVEGHRGVFAFGRAGDVTVAAAEGRLHLYEGIDADVATLPIRLFARLGCRTLILTGAVGSLREELRPGDIVAVKDHINMNSVTPADGPEFEKFGSRFVSPAGAYSEALRIRAVEAATDLGFEIKEAVYFAAPNVCYQTAAEAAAFASLGGDIIGKSIPHEVLVAKQQDVPVLALCVVTNFSGAPEQTHDEVVLKAREAAAGITAIISSVIRDYEESSE